MNLYDFGLQTGHKIETHGSLNLYISRLLHLQREAALNLLVIGREGLVGYHQAATPQLFLVIEGEGWVSGEARQRIRIHAGQAAFWQGGEWHEAGSLEGMTALVIEGPQLDLEYLTAL